MTKKEMLTELAAGKRITHMYFEPNEHIYMKDGEIHDEKGYVMSGPGYDFWTDRTGEAWETDWELYKHLP